MDQTVEAKLCLGHSLYSHILYSVISHYYKPGLMNMFDIIEIINTKELLKKKILRYGNPSIYLTDRS